MATFTPKTTTPKFAGIVLDLSIEEARVLLDLVDTEDDETTTLRRENQWVYDLIDALGDVQA